MSKKIGIVVAILFSMRGFSQEINMLDVQFGVYGKKDDAVGINNSEIKLKLPIKFHKGFLVNGFSYSQYDLDYNSNELLNSTSIATFKTVSYNLSYIQKLRNKWSYVVIASPIISSNFESSLTMDDVGFNGGLIFNKSNVNSNFKIGLIYNTAMGFDGPMPFINYSRKISDRISFDLGFPITKIDFKIDDRNKVNLHLKPKGFYSNIGNNMILDNSEIAEKAKYQSFVTGVNYLHTINNYWKISLDVGYQITSDYDLLNGKGDSIYSFDTKNSIYTGVSLKFDLLKSRNKK